MILTIERKWKKKTYTIGILHINGERFCETLEDKDRGLKSSSPLSQLKMQKIPGETAIPTGVYKVAMNTISPKYAAVEWFKDLCGGRMPRLANVPAFSGLLIHPGNTALDTQGCILVGRNAQVGRLTKSRETFEKLYRILSEADNRGEEILIEII